MLGLLLVAMGVLGASLVIDDGTDFVPVANEEMPPDEDMSNEELPFDEDIVGEPIDPVPIPEDPDEEEPVIDNDRQIGIVAMAVDIEDHVGTPFDDVIGNEYNTVFNEETCESEPVDSFVDAGAGNDRLYLSGGIVAGGEGDDSISVFFSLAAEFAADRDDEVPGERPVAFGDGGNDVIEVFDSPGVIDAGEGNDTVILHNPFGWEEDLDVTLGEGDDLIRILSGHAPSRILGELHDFDPAQDRIEIIRDLDRPSRLSPMTGFDVTIAPLEGEEASLMSIALRLEDPQAAPEVYQFLVHGMEPSQADDIQVDFVDEEEEAVGTPLESLRVDTDLVFTIGLGDLNDLSLTSLVLQEGETNPLADITRVVLNIDEAIEGQFEIYDSTTFSGSKSGADGSSGEYLHIVHSPPGLEAGTITSFVRVSDDTTYLSSDGPPDRFLSDTPNFLPPSTEIVRIYLGSVLFDFGGPDDGFSTVNDVEVVVNRIPVAELGAV
jgi:Ca2+-binding RTX toxin-like protein